MPKNKINLRRGKEGTAVHWFQWLRFWTCTISLGRGGRSAIHQKKSHTQTVRDNYLKKGHYRCHYKILAIKQLKIHN